MSGAVRGTDGFAMRLADDLLNEQIEAKIFCHSSWGHATKNPYAYWITGSAGEKKVDRYPVVTKVGPDWKEWFKDMRNWTNRLRYLLPIRGWFE